MGDDSREREAVRDGWRWGEREAWGMARGGGWLGGEGWLLVGREATGVRPCLVLVIDCQLIWTNMCLC
jgi:hypothetical protein